MPQPPLQVDAIQLEPGSGDTLLIERDTVTGAILFTDPTIPAGVTLTDLAGTASVASVRIVATSGAGAEFTVIQDALDDVPDSSSSTDPHVILVYPGVYTENVLVEKDGVALIAIGRVTIVAAASGHTVTVKESVTATPMWFRMQGFRIENSEASMACLFIDGTTHLDIAAERFEVFDCDFVATGVSGFQIRALDSHNIMVCRGTCEESTVVTSIFVDQCNHFTLDDVKIMRGGSFAYDEALNVGAFLQPSDATNHYRVSNSSLTGDIAINVDGAGTFCLFDNPIVGNLLVAGDRETLITNSSTGTIATDVGTPVRLVRTSHGTLSGAGTVEEERQFGTITFAATATETVAFDVAHPDTSYMVILEPLTTDRAVVASKTVAGFDITFPAGVQTTTVLWRADREV